MKHISKLLLGIIVGSLILLQSCKKEPVTASYYIAQFDNSVARNWFNLHTDLVKETPGFTAPVAARSFAYAGIALYQSILPGMLGYKTIEGKINELPEHKFSKADASKTYNWGIVANAALAEFQRSLFKTATTENKEKINKLETTYLEEFKTNVSQEIIDNSVAYGKLIAKEVYAFSITDGMDAAYNTNYPAYSVPKGPGKWIPTSTQQIPLQPYWGVVRPFLNENTELAQIPSSPAFSIDPASDFYKQASEVNDIIEDITREQSIIADFWSDEPGKSATPAGHSISIASQILEKEKASLSLAAETYLKVGLALHDSYISCWKCKYKHNLIRPVSYIKTHINPEFNTVVYTPPTPEYTSDYAAQSSAVFTVLEDLFGKDYHFSDFTNFNRDDIVGIPRNYFSFEEAAKEVALAGLYGGIHFRSSIDAGLEQGKQIGANINAIKIK